VEVGGGAGVSVPEGDTGVALAAGGGDVWIAVRVGEPGTALPVGEAGVGATAGALHPATTRTRSRTIRFIRGGNATVFIVLEILGLPIPQAATHSHTTLANLPEVGLRRKARSHSATLLLFKLPIESQPQYILANSRKPTRGKLAKDKYSLSAYPVTGPLDAPVRLSLVRRYGRHDEHPGALFHITVKVTRFLHRATQRSHGDSQRPSLCASLCNGVTFTLMRCFVAGAKCPGRCRREVVPTDRHHVLFVLLETSEINPAFGLRSYYSANVLPGKP
jgi:hypothetical protein